MRFRVPTIRVFDQRDQAVDVRGTLRHHMAVLGQVPAQGVDALRPLPHQQVAGPETTVFACCASSFTGTKRIPGRCAASQIASASATSF